MYQNKGGGNDLVGSPPTQLRRRGRSNTITGGGVHSPIMGGSPFGASASPTIRKMNATPPLKRGDSQGIMSSLPRENRTKSKAIKERHFNANKKSKISNLNKLFVNQHNTKGVSEAKLTPDSPREMVKLSPIHKTNRGFRTPPTIQTESEKGSFQLIGYNSASPHSTKTRRFEDEVIHLKNTLKTFMQSIMHDSATPLTEKIEKNRDDLYWAVDVMMMKNKKQQEEHDQLSEAYENVKERLGAVTKAMQEKQKKDHDHVLEKELEKNIKEGDVKLKNKLKVLNSNPNSIMPLSDVLSCFSEEFSEYREDLENLSKRLSFYELSSNPSKLETLYDEQVKEEQGLTKEGMQKIYAKALTVDDQEEYPMQDELSDESLEEIIDKNTGFIPKTAFMNYFLGIAETEDNEKLKMMEAPESDHVIMVFTDIKSSTRLWESNATQMMKAVLLHDQIIRKMLSNHNGYEVKNEGDGFMCAFEKVSDAIEFAMHTHLELLQAPWDPKLLSIQGASEIKDKEENVIFKGLTIRIGIHVGPAERRLNPITNRYDYFGSTVNKAARLESEARSGEIAVSSDIYDFIRLNKKIMENLWGDNRGNFSLKGFSKREEVVVLVPLSLKERVQYNNEMASQLVEKRPKRTLPIRSPATIHLKDLKSNEWEQAIHEQPNLNNLREAREALKSRSKQLRNHVKSHIERISSSNIQNEHNVLVSNIQHIMTTSNHNAERKLEMIQQAMAKLQTNVSNHSAACQSTLSELGTPKGTPSSPRTSKPPKKKLKRQASTTKMKKNSKSNLFQKQHTIAFEAKSKRNSANQHKEVELLNELKKSKSELKMVRKAYKKLKLKIGKDSSSSSASQLLASSFPSTSFEFSNLPLDSDTPVTPVSPSSNDSVSPSNRSSHFGRSLDDTPAHMAMVMMDNIPSASPKTSTKLPKLNPRRARRSKTVLGTPERQSFV